MISRACGNPVIWTGTQALVLITTMYSTGSGEPVHMSSLARALLITYTKINMQIEEYSDQKLDF